MPFTEIPFDLSLLASAVEATDTSFVITDHALPDNPIIFCNNAFERLTGYCHEDIIGKNCRFLQGTDRNQPQLSELRRAILEDKACNVQLRNYRKDGSAFLNEVAMSPIYSETGEVTHLIGIQREVSPGKPMAELLRHEWRTPITIVKSTLQLLQQKGLSADPAALTKILEAAIRAIDKLEKLTASVTPESLTSAQPNIGETSL
jgi:PAS domain S-box-containing protein